MKPALLLACCCSGSQRTIPRTEKPQPPGKGNHQGLAMLSSKHPWEGDSGLLGRGRMNPAPPLSALLPYLTLDPQCISVPMALCRNIKEVPSWPVLGAWLGSCDVVGGSCVGMVQEARGSQGLESSSPGVSLPWFVCSLATFPSLTAIPFMCVSVAGRSPGSCAASVGDQKTLTATAGGSLPTERAHS